VLVGGIGYRNLRDGSIGLHVIERLADRAADGIEVEDVSYHPVGLSQNLQERSDYDRIVLVGAVARGREPGTVTAYRWDGLLPADDEVQARVSEAVTGVISLDNTLVVCGALGGLPSDVRVVEVEPASQDWGEELSPQIEERLPEIVEAVWSSTRP
jgi:hydrogenase maturation protease